MRSSRIALTSAVSEPISVFPLDIYSHAVESMWTRFVAIWSLPSRSATRNLYHSDVPETHLQREGELIYRDDRAAIVRSWPWREANRTRITNDSGSVLLYIESINAERRVKLDSAAEA
jgi:hypothetical protein